MPYRRAIRKSLSLIGKHDSAILFVLLIVTLFLSVFAAVGWVKARDAQHRLNTVEATQKAELLGKHIADVTTCFNASKNRPRLITILRGIAVELEPDPRQQLYELLDEYEATTPTVVDCVALARKYGIDPKPYVQNPPSAAGSKR